MALNKNSKSYKIIKSIAFTVLFIGGCTSSFLIGKEVGFNSPATTKYYLGNTTVATVDGKKISSSRLKAHMTVFFHMNKSTKFTDEEIKNEEDQYLEYILLNDLIYERAKDSDIEIDSDAVNSNFTAVVEQLVSVFNTEDEDKIFKKLGLTKDDVLNSIKQDFIVTAYLENNSQVTEEELLSYYNLHQNEFAKYRASHILIPITDSEGNELSDEDKKIAREKAENLLNDIKNGANFEELAKEHSSDATASDGGDLGEFGAGVAMTEFEDALNEIEVGTLYPTIIETSLGYHIMKKTDFYIDTFENSKETISMNLTTSKQSELLEKIKSEHDIKIKK